MMETTVKLLKIINYIHAVKYFREHYLIIVSIWQKYWHLKARFPIFAAYFNFRSTVSCILQLSSLHLLHSTTKHQGQWYSITISYVNVHLCRVVFKIIFMSSQTEIKWCRSYLWLDFLGSHSSSFMQFTFI